MGGIPTVLTKKALSGNLLGRISTIAHPEMDTQLPHIQGAKCGHGWGKIRLGEGGRLGSAAKYSTGYTPLPNTHKRPTKSCTIPGEILH